MLEGAKVNILATFNSKKYEKIVEDIWIECLDNGDYNVLVSEFDDYDDTKYI